MSFNHSKFLYIYIIIFKIIYHLLPCVKTMHTTNRCLFLNPIKTEKSRGKFVTWRNTFIVSKTNECSLILDEFNRLLQRQEF